MATGASVLKRRIFVVLGAVVLAAGFGVFVGAAPASAAYDDPYCYVPRYWHCYTRPIAAHSTQHWVRVKVAPGVYYEVTDLDTGHIVDRGMGTWNWKTTYGLYGNRYQLYAGSVLGGDGEAHIANCTSLCTNH
jgi:hypothetical protein